MVRHGFRLASFYSVPLAPQCRRGWPLAETDQAFGQALAPPDGLALRPDCRRLFFDQYADRQLGGGGDVAGLGRAQETR